MALNIENIVAELKEATILELNDLVKAIEEEFGVTAAAPVAVAAAGGAICTHQTRFLMQKYLRLCRPTRVFLIYIIPYMNNLG